MATAAGTATKVHGRFSEAVDDLQVTIVCQGDGYPTIATSDGFTANDDGVGSEPPNRGKVCSSMTPVTSNYGLSGELKEGRMRFTVRPHGHITWAVSFASLG